MTWMLTLVIVFGSHTEKLHITGIASLSDCFLQAEALTRDRVEKMVTAQPLQGVRYVCVVGRPA